MSYFFSPCCSHSLSLFIGVSVSVLNDSFRIISMCCALGVFSLCVTVGVCVCVKACNSISTLSVILALIRECLAHFFPFYLVPWCVLFVWTFSANCSSTQFKPYCYCCCCHCATKDEVSEWIFLRLSVFVLLLWLSTSHINLSTKMRQWANINAHKQNAKSS